MSRIVIVDDDATSVQFLAKLVARLGHEVKSYQMGEDAIQRGRETRPDLLITDWILKDQMDGAGVVQAFREESPDLPVIVISGLPRHDLTHAIRKLGNATLVEKPIDFGVLSARIEECTSWCPPSSQQQANS